MNRLLKAIRSSYLPGSSMLLPSNISFFLEGDSNGTEVCHQLCRTNFEKLQSIHCPLCDLSGPFAGFALAIKARYCALRIAGFVVRTPLC